MLTLENLRITIDDFTLSANWSVAAGTKLAIIGPSGAGKSTLLMAIAGFVPLGAGRIIWAGQDIAALAPGDRPLSILFQDQNLFPHLTVTQNLGLGLSSRLALTQDQHDQITTALARVGLSGMGARKPGALSGGQQGRVALARALLRARPILLLETNATNLPFCAVAMRLGRQIRLCLGLGVFP